MAALIVLGGAFFLLGRGGDDETASGPVTTVGPETEVTRGELTLVVPAGWAVSDSDDPTLVISANREDLALAAPRGPRLTVQSGSAERRDPQQVAAVLRLPEPNVEIDVVEDPAEVSFGGVTGVSVTVREVVDGTPVIRSYIIVNVDGTTAYQFILEAGEDVWAEHRSTLEAIVASVVFEPREAAQQPTTTVAALPAEPTTSSSSSTTTTAPGGGFATAEEAIYAAFGYGDSPVMHCNSAESGAANPCYDQHGFFTYLFRPQFQEWYWALVDEYDDGTFTVVETVAVGGEFDFTNPPWDE